MSIPGIACPSSPAKEIAMKVVKAAAVQLSPVLYSREGTVEKVVRKLLELGQQGVQFATFAETVVPYYQYFSFVQSPFQNIVGPEQRKLLDQAVTVPSPATNAISNAAKQAGVVVSIGVNERDGGTLYNTQLLFDADGTLIQRRRKHVQFGTGKFPRRPTSASCWNERVGTPT
jgi:nitrilase